jgi:hypothetical protein
VRLTISARAASTKDMDRAIIRSMLVLLVGVLTLTAATAASAAVTGAVAGGTNTVTQ